VVVLRELTESEVPDQRKGQLDEEPARTEAAPDPVAEPVEETAVLENV